MNKRIPGIFGLLLVILACWLLITTNQSVRIFIDHLEKLGYDFQLKLHVLTQKTVRLSPVAIIDIDDKSLAALGRWPWPRSKMADLTNLLFEKGAAVISFDIFFSEPQTNLAQSLLQQLNNKKLITPEVETTLKKVEPLFDEDVVFAKSLAKGKSNLAISFLPRAQTQNQLPTPLFILSPQEQNELSIVEAEGFIGNIPILQQSANGGGFINIFPDEDGIIRKAPLVIRFKNEIYGSLALKSVLAYLKTDINLFTPLYGAQHKLEGIQIGNELIPTDESGQILIPYVGLSYTFPFYSAIDVFNGIIPDEALKDKILLVGTSATGLGDLQAAAIESPFPGVEIQATIINGLLQNNFAWMPAWTYGANFFITIVVGVLLSFIFPFLGARLLGFLVIFLPMLILILNEILFRETKLILSALMPILLVLTIGMVNIIYGFLFETLRREKLKEMFGQYVPEKHIDRMLQSSSTYALGGEDREMTVLFADIRNFTSISENLRAHELVDFLNAFFTPMTEVIFKNQGTVDKYVGDLIMAFWGAPLISKNHAKNAIKSAIEMHHQLKELNKNKTNEQWPHINIGVGINTGEMSVGDMGSRYRRNYTVLGDSVNLASRVESLTKFYGTSIIVTEHTQKNQSDFIFRLLDKVKVKGKINSIDLYEVIGFNTELTDEIEKELKQYNEALNLYFNKAWEESAKIFLALEKTYPDKKIYHVYLHRINEFKITPPPNDWDGVFVHTHK